jgi:predicted MPP superfamily phosphohydrolase
VALLAARIAGAPADPLLGIAASASLLAGAWARLRAPRLVELEVPIAGLHDSLDGYRIAQLSDIHCGAHTPPERVRRWVERLNRARPDLIAVTGDLITSGSRYTGPIAEVLGALSAPDGVYACMGNHDYFTDGEHFVGLLASRGLEVLRNQGKVIERRGARLFVAGVDDTWTSRDDVEGALRDRPDGIPTLLLAHDPNLFPQAAALDVELTLSGHTHGGQLALPWMSRTFNLARIVTRFTAGLYRRDRSWLYVSRGAGTTGPPVRLGAPAELTILTLRRA